MLENVDGRTIDFQMYQHTQFGILVVGLAI